MPEASMAVKFVRAIGSALFERRLQEAYAGGYRMIEYKVNPLNNDSGQIIYTAVLEHGRPNLTPVR